MTTIDIQIRFSDLDAFRHVNNAQIVQYYDLGISNYISNLGILNIFSGNSMVKVHIEMNFYDSINLQDKIEVQTSVSKVGNKSITFFQRVVESDSGKIKSDCVTVLAGFNVDTQQSVEVPQEWKDLIQNHENKLG